MGEKSLTMIEMLGTRHDFYTFYSFLFLPTTKDSFNPDNMPRVNLLFATNIFNEMPPK